jgi:hypothetical protein
MSLEYVDNEKKSGQHCCACFNRQLESELESALVYQASQLVRNLDELTAREDTELETEAYAFILRKYQVANMPKMPSI